MTNDKDGAALLPCPFCGSDRVTIWNVPFDAAGVREACAKVADAVAKGLADAENAGSDEAEEAWHSGCAHGAKRAADQIRALPIPEAPTSVVDREITTKPVAVGETAAGVTQVPASVEPVEAKYLICKGGAYYRHNAQGYTRNRAKAGRYTLEEAISYSHPNGPDGPRDGITYELDTAPPSPGFGGGDLREALEHIYNLPGELNLANYNEDDVRELNENFIDAILTAEKALAALPPVKQSVGEG